MKYFQFAILLTQLAILSSCGNSNEAAKTGPGVPLNSKGNWTAELIEKLIACQPNPGKVCDCVIPKITEKYTPDQVKEKSPYVAADMLAFKAQCSDTDKPISPVHPIAPEKIGYSSLKGENCETGAHEFKSKEELCAGLQSEELNQNCAQKLRKSIFQTMCPGSFQPKP